MQRSPMPRKRLTPRANRPERITAQRIKRKAGAAPTAQEKRHMDRLASLGCLVCGDAATIHHVTSDGFQRIARLHSRVTPLCPRHHLIQHGPHDSVEALGHHRFFVRHGVNLLKEADRLWDETCSKS